MRAISFAWTTPAFKARQKTVTRREWSDGYARSFKAGEVVEALARMAWPRKGRVLLLAYLCHSCGAWHNRQAKARSQRRMPVVA